MIKEYYKYGLVLLLILVSTLTWLGYADVPIANEDFLILSWNEPKSFSDAFDNFVKKDVGGPYWRPVTWTADMVTKYYWGYNPIPYHVTNIAVYAAICILLFSFFQKIGFDFIRAWSGAFIFSVLPSHELSVAWVAGRTDMFMFFFMLISILFYLKKPAKTYTLILSGMFFFLSVLSKEPAFAGAALPLLLLMLNNDENSSTKKAFVASIAGITIVLIVLIYRYFVIGGSPFESANFYNPDLKTIVLNFIAYLPVSIIRADTMSIIEYHVFYNSLILALLSLLCIILLLMVFLRLRKISVKERKRFYFGIIWFVIFIFPATYSFGQWYAFASSVGLIISIMALFEINPSKISGKIILSLIIILGVLSSVNLNYRSTKWHNSANISHSVFGSIKYKPNPQDTIILLGVPDKVDMINCAKIGCAQAVWYNLHSQRIEVSSPLRIEMNSDAVISYDIVNDSMINMKITNGRFLRVASRSRTYIIPEKMSYEDGFQKFEIETVTNPSIISNAIIMIKEKSLRNRIFIFTGREFKHIILPSQNIYPQ